MSSSVLHICDHKYEQAIINVNNLEITVNGFENIGQVFHGDIVNIIDNKLHLVESKINTKIIVGILVLYSKYKFPKNNRGVERFKFIPLSKHFPEFLVATKVKKKYKTNILVTIKYLTWITKLPYGEIRNILGKITDIDCLYDIIQRFKIHMFKHCVFQYLSNIFVNAEKHNF